MAGLRTLWTPYRSQCCRRWVWADYAEMVLDRDDPGDHEKAVELQDEAIAISRELGMKLLLEGVLAQREMLTA